MAGAVAIDGLRDLQRAFAAADKTLKTELVDSLKRAAEPARVDAEKRAVNEITNIGDDWSKMRIGVTQRLVYIAPVERGVKTRAPQRSLLFGLIRLHGPLGKQRPNLAPLLKEQMELALEHNKDEVVKEIDRMLETVGRAWEAA